MLSGQHTVELTLNLPCLLTRGVEGRMGAGPDRQWVGRIWGIGQRASWVVWWYEEAWAVGVWGKGGGGANMCGNVRLPAGEVG